MGSSQSYSYAVEVPGSTSDEEHSRVFRAATNPDQLCDNMLDTQLTSRWDVFQTGLKKNPDATMLKYICPQSNALETMSYAAVEKAALAVGSALLNLDLVPVKNFPDESYPPARELQLFSIFSKNCKEWFILEQAANAYGLTLVPIYDAINKAELSYIFSQTKCATVAGPLSNLKLLVEAIGNDDVDLENLIVLDSNLGQKKAEEEFQHAKKKYNVWLFSSLVNNTQIRPIQKGSLDHVADICYTSGTTGHPKGVILTDGNLISCVAGSIRGPLSSYFKLQLSNTDVHFSYLPLAHVYERVVCNIVFYLGACVAIYSGKVSQIQQNLSTLKPTVLIAVPRVLTRLHETFTTELRKRSRLTQLMFFAFLRLKRFWMQYVSRSLSFPLDNLVFGKMKQALGGRLRYVLVGSASMNPAISDDLRAMLSIPICEGYGLSESFGASFVSLPISMISGTVGGPIPCVEFRIKKTTDAITSSTSEKLRGELLLKGPSIFPAYFRDRSSTEQAFDCDGWLQTGDVVELMPNKAIKIIDRIKGIFKLAQGEYVSGEKLEDVYALSPWVNQLFVYGDSSRENLVAIVVPRAEKLREWAEQNGKSTSQALNDPEFHNMVLDALEETANEHHLKGFEKIKAIRCRSDPFTTENNLMTPTLKTKRQAVKAQHWQDIESMYAALKRR